MRCTHIISFKYVALALLIVVICVLGWNYVQDEDHKISGGAAISVVLLVVIMFAGMLFVNQAQVKASAQDDIQNSNVDLSLKVYKLCSWLYDKDNVESPFNSLDIQPDYRQNAAVFLIPFSDGRIYGVCRHSIGTRDPACVVFNMKTEGMMYHTFKLDRKYTDDEDKDILLFNKFKIMFEKDVAGVSTGKIFPYQSGLPQKSFGGGGQGGGYDNDNNPQSKIGLSKDYLDKNSGQQ